MSNRVKRKSGFARSRIDEKAVDVRNHKHYIDEEEIIHYENDVRNFVNGYPTWHERKPESAGSSDAASK